MNYKIVEHQISFHGFQLMDIAIIINYKETYYCQTIIFLNLTQN